MKYPDHVVKRVASLSVPETQRLSFAQAARQDQDDAKLVEANLPQYQQRLIPIVSQLRKFSGKNFPIVFERHYRRGLAKTGGVISIDFATLNKPLSELALTVAHEWGHQSMGHLANEYCAHALGIPVPEAERQADYYGGIFLGIFEYDIEEVLKIKLSMPQTDPEHGTRFDRACAIMQGYHQGQEMRNGNRHHSLWPDFELPLHEVNETKLTDEKSQESSARKLSK